MFAKTHLAITIFFVLLFLPFVKNEFYFVLFSLVSTFLPDVDSKFSLVGKSKSFRIIQLFLKHRGILHSFIFMLSIALLLVILFPVSTLPFILGYGLHLIADSFTPSGVKLFYPYEKKYFGFVKTGGRMETAVFVIFLLGDLFLLFRFV